MRATIKKYGGLIYIGVMAVVLLAIILLNDELPETLKTLMSLRVVYVWMGVALLGLYLFARMLTLRYYLHRHGIRASILHTLVITGVGQFYSAITPSSSGGQPMQVYYMHKLGMPVSVATGAISAKFIGFQIAVLATGALLWCTHAHMVARQLSGVRYLVAIGFVMNILFMVAVGATSVKSVLIDRMLSAIVRFLARIRIVKNEEAMMDKAHAILSEYQQSMRALLERPMDAVVILILSFLQVLCYMGILPCLYKAFGNVGFTFLELLTLQTLLFIAASFVPLPGAAGAQEGGFYLFFLGVFGQTQMFAAMVSWRFFTYYALMLFGMVMLAVYGAISYMQARRDTLGR